MTTTLLTPAPKGVTNPALDPMDMSSLEDDHEPNEHEWARLYGLGEVPTHDDGPLAVALPLLEEDFDE